MMLNLVRWCLMVCDAQNQIDHQIISGAAALAVAYEAAKIPGAL